MFVRSLQDSVMSSCETVAANNNGNPIYYLLYCSWCFCSPLRRLPTWWIPCQASHVMASTRSTETADVPSSERGDPPERYEFVPETLRHHFKVQSQFFVDESDSVEERQLVRRARQTRSAHLVADLLSQPPPPPPVQLLYSNAIERAITARMTFSRALEGLERYFDDVIAKVKQLQDQHPSGVCDSTDAKIPTLVQAQRQIVNVCQSCLSDCDIYLGMYEVLPSPPAASSTPVVKFAACSAKSSMLYQSIDCPLQKLLEGDQPQDNQADDQKLRGSMCVTMQAMAAREAIVVDDIAELAQNEIHRFAPEETMTGPFSCFPLLAGVPDECTSAIGVLSVDACRKAQRLLPQAMSADALYAFLLRMQLNDAAIQLKKARFDGTRFLALTEVDLRNKPIFQSLKVATKNRLLELIRSLLRGSRIHLSDTNERAPPFTEDENALEFLESVSKLSGRFLDTYRRVHWIQEIANITRDPNCTAYDVYDVLIRGITRSMEPLERVAIWKISQKESGKVSSAMEELHDWEIEVVASTAIPNDRVEPFHVGQDWKTKRIDLHKENEDAIRAFQRDGSSKHAPLLRGGIINVMSTSSTVSSRYSGLPCENAFYQLWWSDRSLQTVSWCKLRQLLPIRNMNAKHFQLRQLCYRLSGEAAEIQKERDIGARPKAIKIDNPNGLVLIIRDCSRPKSEKYVLEVDFAAQCVPQPDVFRFLEKVVEMAEQALVCVRGREARYAKRKLAVAKNFQRFQSIGLNPSGDALRALHDIIVGIFDDVAENMPGVHVQISELQADGTQLTYTFTGNGSTVLGCTLNRGQGVSFKCLDNKQPLVVGPTSDLRSRLQRMGIFRNQPEGIEDAFPFIFVPLFHEDCAIGVLSVDSFLNVPKGRPDETHPEAGILEFLVPLSKLIASAIYAKRRSHALYQLHLSCQEPLRSPHQLLFYACCALKNAMVGAGKVRALEIDGERGKTTLVYDFSESERELARSWLFNVVRPMAFRWKELCSDTILHHMYKPQSNSESQEDGLIKLLAAIREDEQEHREVAARYQQLLADEKDASPNAPRRSAFETEKSKLFERLTADKYFLLLNEAGDGPLTLTKESVPMADRLTSTKYIAHAMKLFLGTTAYLYSGIHAMTRSSSLVFIVVSSSAQLHASCDQVYLDRVTSITSKYMAALQERVKRSRERTVALRQFKDMCQKILIDDTQSIVNTRGGRHQHKLPPTKEVEMESLLRLQQDTIALIEQNLKSPNVYFGIWEPALRILRYTSASKRSIMTGKKLRHGYGVSFEALERQISIVVTSQDAANQDDTSSYAKKLRYFTSEPAQNQKWPFIVVPVGNLGVLALDNLESYERDTSEEQPELGVVDFLRKIGQTFAEVLAVIRGRTIQERQLRRDEALVRVMTACEDFKPTSKTTGTISLYLPHLVIQEVENALNGVDAYIGMVDPLCERIRFICASSNSKMENKTVDTFRSISFQAFASQRTIVIPQMHQYLKQQRHLQQHDVEHGQKLKYFGREGSPHGPFVCVPVPFVGVLSVDTFPGGAGGIFSPSFPEDGVVPFLEKVANYLGENIRMVAAADARKLLPTLFRGNRTTFSLLFGDALQIISQNLFAVFHMLAVQFEQNVATGHWTKKAVLATKKRSNHPCSESTEDETLLAQSLEVWLSQSLHREIITNPSDQRSVFNPVYQLPGRPETLVVHCSPTRDVDSDGAELLPTVLVFRRVNGSTWSYDEDFLLSILPLINSLIALVNIRVEGIVARRLAERKLHELCFSLDTLVSNEAYCTMYATILPNAMETIAQAMSLNNADAYLGQRELTDRDKSQMSRLQLRFVATSSQSYMKDVALNLENKENDAMTVVQCLKSQQATVVILPSENVHQLTRKPAQRVFIVVPMGDNYVLCLDSLGQEAFVPGKKQLVEPDIIAFFKKSASTLQEAILSTRHRLSYDRLRSLIARPHTDFSLFYATILDGLRQDLVNVHSLQVLALGEDYTKSFRLEAWHRSRTRRPMQKLPGHFCSINRCEKAYIEHEIHFETQLLPMTNLPRTLDRSRAQMQPTEGTEKHGLLTCGCLATMLDSSITAQNGDARLALCIFSHDASANGIHSRSRMLRQTMMPPDYGDSTAFFTNYQRQYFFAFAAVVADVYVHVLRACALETFSIELFITLQEYLDAKDGLVIRFDYGKQRNDENTETGSGTSSFGRGGEASKTDGEGYVLASSTASSRANLIAPVVLFSQLPGKTASRQPLSGKLERKAREFEVSKAPLTVFMTKKAIPAPPTKTSVDTTKLVPDAKSKGSQGKPSKHRGPTSLFGGRTLFRYGKKKKKNEEEEKAKEQELLVKAIPELQALSPSRTQQLRLETVSLHVFLRVLDYNGRHDVIYFTVEKQSLKAVSAVEELTRFVKSRADNIAKEIITKPPRGDEEVNAKRFSSDAASLVSSDRGGGGFLVLSLLKRAQAKFQGIETVFGEAMRQYLTGAQNTARDTHLNASERLAALFGNSSSRDDGSDSASTPTTALLRVTLAACSVKRETVISLEQTDLLKEYLRIQAGRKLLQLDPTDKKVWGRLGRARTLLRSFDSIIHELGSSSDDDIKPVEVKAEATWALHALLNLLLAQSAVVRYLKYLETEIGSERRQYGDAPAITVQCFVRQTQARVALKTRRREFYAALAIQCAFRQHLARRRVLFMKWIRAAITIQRAYRRKRQRTKGSRPQRFTSQLLSASQKYGAMGRSQTMITNENMTGGAWRTDMAAFGSFQDYVASKAGREQIKQEEELMWRHRRELEKERTRLPRNEALREDVSDLFELLDDAGAGELSRERTAALITRLHVPLNEEEVADVVAMMDSDGSGGISMDEFMKWFSHEFPLLQKRAPRVCGIVTRRDWQWVIEQSARSAILKRWRAMRAGEIASATGESTRYMSGSESNTRNDAIQEEDGNLEAEGE
ncbi:unnamed protein product [Phytophthora fragariaefolia]|uniref:Unnamed protein product n=1 Tax=Phytophthora fragariaefolia TaxID=1490495 RepID=A0A9W7CLH7_9STRA|nr:unnamed protein product [Phytophthora fragariaefolia]